MSFQVDPMVIHSASDPRPRTALCGDYFYNYFTRGIDILFDGQVRMFMSKSINTHSCFMNKSATHACTEDTATYVEL